MKVMVIHNGDDTGKALAERVRALRCEVTEQLAVWPGFFHAIHQPHSTRTFNRPAEEQPDIVIVEASSNPSIGREVAGYLGETAFTGHIPVYLVNHPEPESHKARRRAPKASLFTTGQLEQQLAEKIGPVDEDEAADKPVA